MEFVEGRTLRDILKVEGRLPPRRAMEIVAEVCGALDFSHRNGIVHRDIKPANVMITRAGAVKVMDFGIARAIADNSATVTQTAAVIGTAQYLSPEQARGETVDARSDVYSTGCLLYELVTGHPPFTGDSPVAVAYQHVRENPVVPSSENPAIPRALDSIVMKALAKNPMNRYQSAGEMRTDLLRALADRPVEAEAVLTDAERTQYISKVPPGAVPPGAVVPMSADGDDEDDGEGKRRAWLWAALVAALLLVIGGGAWAIWALSGSDSPKKQAVPNVIGMNPAQANAAIASRKFTPPTGTPQTASKCGVNPDTQPIASPTAGTVCTQSPPPNSQQNEGTTITYTVYRAPTVQVPNVSGKQFADASNDLDRAGPQGDPQGRSQRAGRGSRHRSEPESIHHRRTGLAGHPLGIDRQAADPRRHQPEVRRRGPQPQQCQVGASTRPRSSCRQPTKSKDGTGRRREPSAGHAVPPEPADHLVGVRVPATAKPDSDADPDSISVAVVGIVSTLLSAHVGIVVKVAGRWEWPGRVTAGSDARQVDPRRYEQRGG